MNKNDTRVDYHHIIYENNFRDLLLLIFFLNFDSKNHRIILISRLVSRFLYKYSKIIDIIAACNFI